MFIFVVMFISCLVYLFSLMLLKIEPVAANENDSGIGAVTHIKLDFLTGNTQSIAKAD